MPVLAVVKEQELEAVTGPVTDATKLLGLAEFRDKYFCGPLYLSDDDRTLYDFLGNANVFTLGSLRRTLLNPLRRRREYKDLKRRLALKGITGNRRGNGAKKGGVICIAPDGEIVYTHKEQPGKGVPAEARDEIIKAVRSFSSHEAKEFAPFSA